MTESVESHKESAALSSAGALSALLAIKRLLTEIRDRLPEPSTRDDWLDEPVPVPHPDDVAGERIHALEVEVERLRAGIAEAQHVRHLGSDCAACDMRGVLHALLNKRGDSE